MTEGIKFIEEYDADDYAIKISEIVKEYEGQGYEVEVKPQVVTETRYEMGKPMGEIPHYTALVIAKGTVKD